MEGGEVEEGVGGGVEEGGGEVEVEVEVEGGETGMHQI